MKYSASLIFLIIGTIACNSPSSNKNLEKENAQLKSELELYKNIEVNRLKAIQHSATRTFKLEDERYILSVLFDTEEFDIDGRAVWTPNFNESLNFPISYDGFCYTKMDKILLYNDGFSRAIIVFCTYAVLDDGNPDIGRTSSPMLSIAYFTQRDSDKWELSAFKKIFTYHGSWGEIGDIEMKQINKQNFALELAWGYTEMGETLEWTSYYSIPYFMPIFYSITAKSFTGHENGDDKAYSYKVKLTVDSTSDKEYADIIASTSGTKPDETEDKVVSAYNDQTFYYDEQAGVYVEQKFIETEIILDQSL